MPDFVSLESGKDYYLYNVGAEGFMEDNEKDNLLNIDKVGRKVTVSMLSAGHYTVKLTGTDMFMRQNGSGSIFYHTYYENYCTWDFIAQTDASEYKLQVAEGTAFYDANLYAGTKPGEYKMLNNLTAENNITWKLIDGEAGDMYCARVRLYNALNAMDGSAYDIEKFEAVYANESSTVDEIENAAAILSNATATTGNYKFPEWSDYPILLEPSADKNWELSNSSGSATMKCSPKGEQSTLTATVVVDADATLCYEAGQGHSMKVMADGKVCRTFIHDQLYNNTRRYFIELAPGKHTIEWIAQRGSNYNSYYIANIGVEKTPLISVSLLEPGSLGTEILYNVDHIKDVRRLKIAGKMNDDDWAKIDMMSAGLFELDLSEAEITEITYERFFRSGDTKWAFLHSVNLPEGLKKIGSRAFCDSYLDEVNFPSTLESIASQAFYYTNIEKAMLPESCLSLDDWIFYNCYFLKEACLPSKLTTIPHHMYEGCYILQTFKLPTKLNAIGNNAFLNCYNTIFELPETLTSIGGSAFKRTNQNGEKTRLIIPKNVNYIGGNAFSYCDAYTYVELPTTYYKNTAKDIFPSSIKTIRLNSPTVVEHSYRIFNDNLRPNVTLQVPSFLVNAYKLDDYWYNFKAIEGFDPQEIDQWNIWRDLVLGARDRLTGTPSIMISNEGGSLKINGTEGMPINNLDVGIDPDNKAYGRMFSNADNVTVAGTLTTGMRLGTANKWYYLCLPYDVKVSDIVFTNNNPKHAIRYYDGANRAANGAGASWKNYAADDIIPAGTGFIFQVSEAGWWKIKAQENESKQYLTSNKMFVRALAENAAENPSDRGWNLVGNPYQSWYNIHKLNFTAPITVREGNKYAAYSIIDDDYAIAPNQAFFVQCPEGIGSISFPLDGRQMTSVIESQTGLKPQQPAAAKRSLIDITLTADGQTDRTRVVLNNEATAGYDMGCDAGKFMSDVEGTPQIYTIGTQNTKYAINERPEADGVVRMGFNAGRGGCFTIQLTRCQADGVTLVDNQTGTTTDLTAQEYSFTADAGTYDNRFELRLKAPAATAIANTTAQEGVKAVSGGIEAGQAVEVFTAGGVKVAQAASGFVALPAGTYVAKTAAGTTKVIIK